MASLTLTNLIPNPSMDTGWDVAYTPVTSGNAIAGGFGGGYPLKLVGPANAKEKFVKTKDTIPLIPDHLYYARVYGYQTTKTEGASFGFYWVIQEPAFYEYIPIQDAGHWRMYSAINNRKEFEAGSYTFRIDFNNEYKAGTAWVSSPMLIDLTASFGSGNEPTKEWCDEHIPFFAGTRTFDWLVLKLKDITPTMTSNTTPSGYVASASSSVSTPRQAWNAFDNLSSYDEEVDRWHSAAGESQWIQMQFPEQHKVLYISIKNCGEPRHTGINAFTLQGSNNGTSFTNLGSYNNPEDSGTTTYYKVANPGKYKYYRLNISSSHMVISANKYCVIDQIRFYEPYLEGAVKTDGTWKPFYEAKVKIDGEWKNITSLNVKDSTWK